MKTINSSRTYSRAEQIARYFINKEPHKQLNKNLKIPNINDYSTLRDSLTGNCTDSSLSSSITVHKKRNSIPIKKELLKYAEPRFKLSPSFKIPPKFSNLKNPLSSSINFQSLLPNETEQFELDEKISQMRFEQFESKRNIFLQDNFSFRILVEQENCYEEILKELKENGVKNLQYIENLAAQFLALFFDEENTIGSLFQYNKKVNKFLIKELCIVLALLFIGDYGDLDDNEVMDMTTCFFYCHKNFWFIVMLIVNNSSNIQDTVNFLKCKTLLELNSNKISPNKFEKTFRSQNKIIKTVLLNLLSNLKELNPNKTNIILDIFNWHKEKNLIEIRQNLTINDAVLDKIKKITSKSASGSKENEENDQNEGDEENFPQLNVPFIPPKDEKDKREYTLILDLDETLVHYFEDEKEETAYVKVRMGTEEFIATLSKYAEIIIFTASTQNVRYYII